MPAALAVLLVVLGLGPGCAKVAVLPSDPAQAPLKERRLAAPERERLAAQAAAGGAEAAPALYFLGLDAAAQGRWPEAGQRWQAVVKHHAGSGWDRLAQYKTAEALEQVGDGPRAFVQYQGLLTGPAVADLPERARAACLRLIESMPAESLRRLGEGDWAGEEFQPVLRLRLVEHDLAQGLTETARAGLEAFLNRYPQGPGLERAEQLARRLDAAVPVNPRALGLLVPLNGPLAPFGRQLRQGVALALEEANQGLPEDRRFVLHVADEGANTGAAVEAARSLIDDKQVLALLGPLGSESAAGLLPLLAARRLVLFSPSASRADLEGASPWFFRNTLTPARQAAAMADHAVASRGLTRVAVLAPDSPYGQALGRAFAERASELGATVALSLTYAAGTRDFKPLVLALGGIDPGEAKAAEADERRDQQARVEEASTALGRHLLAAGPAKLSAVAALSPTAQGLSPAVQALPLSAPARLRVLVTPFAEDAASAELNAGRAFADRFVRTLGQLAELEIIPPAATGEWLASRQLRPEHMDLPQLAELGQALGAHYVLAGGTAEVEPERPKPGRRDRHFSLVAQLVDPASGEVVVFRRFDWTKYRPPDPNPLGLQALYVPATAEELGRLVPVLAFCELPVPLLGSDQWDRPELLRHLDALEGAVFSAPYWPDSPDEKVRRFDEAYRQAYAARPGLLSAQAFDAASMVLELARAGADDRISLRNALARVRSWEGVSGRAGFEGRQDAVKRPALIQVRQGGLHLLKEP